MKKSRNKRKESLLNKRVLVKWIDSNLSERTWVDLEDYETDISEIESYGIVVHENERSISVAGHYAVGNSNTLEQASGSISHSTHVIGTGNINRIFSNIYTTTFPRSCGKYMNGIFPSGKRCRCTNGENGDYRMK